MLPAKLGVAGLALEGRRSSTEPGRPLVLLLCSNLGVDRA